MLDKKHIDKLIFIIALSFFMLSASAFFYPGISMKLGFLFGINNLKTTTSVVPNSINITRENAIKKALEEGRANYSFKYQGAGPTPTTR